MEDRDREGEDLPPTQSPFSLSPPPASTPSLPSIINLCMPPALLTFSFSFYAYASFCYISIHFLACHQNVCLLFFLHYVTIGNKLFHLQWLVQTSNKNTLLTSYLFNADRLQKVCDYITVFTGICIFKKVQKNCKTVKYYPFQDVSVYSFSSLFHFLKP